MTENNNESTDSRNEKRFTLAYSDDSEKSKWWAVRDEDITLWKEEVVYLLNQLHEENEQLRQVMGFMQNDNANDIWGVLNSRERIFEQLRNENNQLLKEKEDWKGTCITASNENSILWNEIHILMEQGAEPSQSFKEYLESVSTEYDKFWQRKLKKAKESKVV